MPACPICRAEYRLGFLSCSDCQVDLVEHLAVPPMVAESDREWTLLRVMSSDLEARLVQGYLETSGIPCSLESLKFNAEPVNFGPMSRIRVHVLAQDMERAENALCELEASEGLSAEADVQD